MAWTYLQLIAEMHIRQEWAQSDLFEARADYNSARGYWEAADDHAAIDKLISAVEHHNEALENSMADAFYGYDGSTNIVPTALDPAMAFEVAESYNLTMGKVLDIMLVATPDEVLYFIGLVDAYRNSVWTKPFNQEFYAALSKGFQEWP